MKLYYFNPNDHGSQAFVMAESSEKAKEYLLKSKIEPRILDFGDGQIINLNDLRNAVIDGVGNLEMKYTLDEYGVGEVIWSEIS